MYNECQKLGLVVLLWCRRRHQGPGAAQAPIPVRHPRRGAATAGTALQLHVAATRAQCQAAILLPDGPFDRNGWRAEAGADAGKAAASSRTCWRDLNCEAHETRMPAVYTFGKAGATRQEPAAAQQSQAARPTTLISHTTSGTQNRSRPRRCGRRCRRARTCWRSSAATPSTRRTTSCSSALWRRRTCAREPCAWCTPPAAPPR